jgi:hypothetical protein
MSLHLVSLDLDEVIDGSDGADSGLDLHLASHAVHRAMMALDLVESRAHWRPLRVVGLTLDEAIVMMGVIELLCDGPVAPSWLAPLAQSSREKLRERVDAVRGPGSDGWAQVLAN